MLFKLRLVVGEILDLECLGSEEAMAARFRPRCDARDFERDDLAAEQADDRLQRPDPLKRTRPPAHRLGPGEFVHRLDDRLGDDVAGVAAGLFDFGDVEIALLLILDDLSVGSGRKTRGFEKPLQRLLWRADARALLLFRNGRRFGRHFFNNECQAAWSCECCRGARLKPTRLQAFDNETLQIVRRLRLHARRDFFGKQFEQKFRHSRPIY